MAPDQKSAQFFTRARMQTLLAVTTLTLAGLMATVSILMVVFPASFGPLLMPGMWGAASLLAGGTAFAAFRALAGHGPAGLAGSFDEAYWRLDAGLCITGLGGAVLALTGLRPGDLTGRPLADLVPGDQAQGLAQAIQETRPFSFETCITCPDGSVRHIRILGGGRGGRKGYYGLIRDISAIRALEKKAADLEEKLAQAEKMAHLGVLAGCVAHDLNNILSGIATYPEVMLMDRGIPPTVRQGLAMIRDSGRKASSVVSDLLTISRGASAEKQILNINKVIERYMGAAEFGSIQTRYPGVEIETDLEPELLNISGSYIHIEKAVMNLVLNAVEETAGCPSGQVTIATANYFMDDRKKVTVAGRDPDLAPGEYAVLSVSDNGKGIPAEHRENIFTPFFTRKVMGKSGTGLGLTVVWNAVQDNQGRLRLVSGKSGTRFDLFFPAVRKDLPEENTRTLTEIQGNGEQILVVDDLASQRKIAATILTQLGYKVISAPSGEAAVAMVSQAPVDLLVLDMIMEPGISGLETYQQIQNIYPDQKAIIASGHPESQDVLKAQAMGAGTFVKKPYTVLDMGIAVKEELENL